MSKRLYNYKFTFTPAAREFNSRNTKPVSYVSFIYKVPSVGVARRLWKLTQLKTLRKNGLRAPASTPLKIERITLTGKVR